MRTAPVATTCASCGEVARQRTKGLCPRCYAKSRQRLVVCVGCGQKRLEHRSGRCARCYRLAHLAVGTCQVCGEQRSMWGTTCRRCQVRARSTGGSCEHCGRVVARLWGRRCARCAKSHWATGSCESCLAWTTSIESRRCRGCREFDGYNTGDKPCRSCGRHLQVNRYERCRLCTVTRRQLRAAGDPNWSDEPGDRDGIQLFFGDLYTPQGRRSPSMASDLGWAPVTSSADEDSRPIAIQRQLFFVPLDLGQITRPGDTGKEPRGALAGAVARFAEARGWKEATTKAVTQAMALLAQQGPDYPNQETFAELRRLRLPVSRVREFLAAQGAVPANQTELPCRIRGQIAGLPAPMDIELSAWVEVLEGHFGRGRPLQRDTIRHYVLAVAPALAQWSATHTSLREITTDDVAAEVADLQGARRVFTTVALRSLFGALKDRRLVFVDPTRALGPGRFPQVPVLGLDASSRSSLLSKLDRPDHRLVVLLAGVHALSRADMCTLTLDDVDLDAKTIVVRGTRRPLDRIVEGHVVDWLRIRRDRWPRSANPHLLVSYKSAYGIGPVSVGYFKGVFANLPTTAAGLRADRLLAEANDGGGDPLRLVRLFGLSHAGALRYCTSSELDTAVLRP